MLGVPSFLHRNCFNKNTLHYCIPYIATSRNSKDFPVLFLVEYKMFPPQLPWQVEKLCTIALLAITIVPSCKVICANSSVLRSCRYPEDQIPSPNALKLSQTNHFHANERNVYKCYSICHNIQSNRVKALQCRQPQKSHSLQCEYHDMDGHVYRLFIEENNA